MKQTWQWLTIIAMFVSLAGCVQRMGEEPEIFKVVRANDARQLSYMFDQGADPNAKNGIDEYLLYVATGNRGGPDVTHVLLDRGADPNVINKTGRTPLHNAASWCTVDSVQLLLDAGADPYIVDDEGRTALDVICQQPAHSRSIVVDLLRKAMSK